MEDDRTVHVFLDVSKLRVEENYAAENCWWVCNETETGIPVALAKAAVASAVDDVLKATIT